MSAGNTPWDFVQNLNQKNVTLRITIIVFTRFKCSASTFVELWTFLVHTYVSWGFSSSKQRPEIRFIMDILQYYEMGQNIQYSTESGGRYLCSKRVSHEVGMVDIKGFPNYSKNCSCKKSTLSMSKKSDPSNYQMPKWLTCRTILVQIPQGFEPIMLQIFRRLAE